jgi:hypothetical protein
LLPILSLWRISGMIVGTRLRALRAVTKFADRVAHCRQI